MSFWDDITGVTAAEAAAEANLEGIQLGLDAQADALTKQLEMQQAGIDAQTLASDKSIAAQTLASENSLAEQQRQFQVLQDAMSPYVEAGEQSLGQQQALSGALGPEAQQAAYDAIQGSAGFQSMLAQGERGILQNATATGGVRGGDTQGALARYSPQLLGQAIDQRYSQLGGLTQMGQASAAGVGAGAMNLGAGMSNTIMGTGQGLANAYANLGAGTANAYNNRSNAYGNFANSATNAYTNIGDINANLAMGTYNAQRNFVGDSIDFVFQAAGLFV